MKDGVGVHFPGCESRDRRQGAEKGPREQWVGTGTGQRGLHQLCRESNRTSYSTSLDLLCILRGKVHQDFLFGRLLRGLKAIIMQVTQRHAAQCMQGCGATEEEVLMSAWHLGEGAWNGEREREVRRILAHRQNWLKGS